MIFVDNGYFPGDLTQTDSEYMTNIEQHRTKDEDGKPFEGAFVTLAPVTLTTRAPCAEVAARMFVGHTFRSEVAHALWHHIWLGWRSLGYSVWRDDFGKPNGLPVALGEAVANFQIRAELLTDLNDPLHED